MIITTSISCIREEFRIGNNRCMVFLSILQENIARIGIDKIIAIVVVFACVPVFIDCWSIIMKNNIISNCRVIINDVAWCITSTDKDPTLSIFKNQVIRNCYIVCCMPEMYTPTGIAINDIVPDMTTQVGLIDAMDTIAVYGRSDVMNHITNDIVVTACVI